MPKAFGIRVVGNLRADADDHTRNVVVVRDGLNQPALFGAVVHQGAHAPEDLRREAKENARGVIPALCFMEDDIMKKFAQRSNGTRCLMMSSERPFDY